MAIARTVDWRLRVPPSQALELLSVAFSKLDLTPQVLDDQVIGHSKAKLLKNRWAADVTAVVRPYDTGSLVDLHIEMLGGNKHCAIAEEIASAIGDSAFDDRGLKAAVDRLGKIGRFGGWLEFRNVRHYLTARETVREIGQGTLGEDQGIVVLTDERLFFFNQHLVGAAVEEFPIDAITSIVASKGRTGESLQVTASGNMAEIKGMMHGQGDALARAFREVRASSHETPPSPNIVQSVVTGADELAKFAALRDQGILSDEEFAAKKAQILGL